MLWAAPQRRTQPTLRGGRFHTVELTTEFLVDHNNPTGYAQIVEELVRDGQGAWQVVRTNTLGLDVISTSVASGDRGLTHGQGDDAPLALVYDASGSTRGLFAAVFTSGQPFVELTGGVEDDAASVQIYDYDAFGQLIRLSAAVLGDRSSNPTTDPGGIQHWRFAVGTPNSVLTDAQAAAALTNLLYRGEQFDAHLGMQYLRARHYDLATGRFNRIDPYAGDSNNPLSFHKYGYAHGNPVRFSDPTGMFVFVDVLSSMKNMAQQFASRALGAMRARKAAVQVKSSVENIQRLHQFLDRIHDTVGFFNDMLDLLSFDHSDLAEIKNEIIKIGSRTHLNVNIVVDLPRGVRARLDRLARRMGGTGNPAFNKFLGELMAGITTRLVGFRNVGFKMSKTGLDSLLYDDISQRFAAIEAKGGSGRLKPGQMRDPWIEQNVRKARRENEYAPMASELERAIDFGYPMWAMVISTDLQRASGEYVAAMQEYPGVDKWRRPL